MGPLQVNLPPVQGAKLIVRACELGVNFVDTAELYDTYPHIRIALERHPELKISTKAYCYDEETAQKALLRAQDGIGRKYIDCFMLHEQESIHTLRGHEAALRFLGEKKAAGEIGAVGVSTHYVDCVRAATRFGGIDVIHPIINAKGIGIADGTVDDMLVAIREAHDAGIGILAMKSLGGGHLLNQWREALAFVLENPFIDSIAVGMQSLEEVSVNCAVFSGEGVDSALEERLFIQKRRLLIQDWCEGCGRCVKRCRHGALTVSEGRAVVDERKCVLCGYCASVCPQFCIKVI